jgi:hypothetical protein
VADALAIVSLVVGVVSVVLGAFAIWLSAVFYNFANEAQERVRETANRVERAVTAIDGRVQGLHGDTFSLVRDMVTDMQTALWTQQSHHKEESNSTLAHQDLEDQISSLRRQLVEDIGRAVGRANIDTAALERSVDEGLRRSADAGVTARHEVVRRAIRQQLARSGSDGEAEAAAIMTVVAQQFPFGAVVKVMNHMRDTGEIMWDGEELRPGTMLRISSIR